MARERLGLPVSKLRRTRRVRTYKRVALSAVIAHIGVGSLILFSYLPALQIQEVAVAGVSTISEAEIRATVTEELKGKYLLVFPKANILFYPREGIAAALAAAHPKLAVVDVGFKTFRSIEVTASEREPHALWCGKSRTDAAECYVLDENGFVFTVAPSFSGSVYLRYYGELAGEKTIGSSYLTPSAFRSLGSLTRALGGAVGDEPRDISVAGGDVVVSLEEGYDVTFVLADDPAEIVKRFTFAFKAEPLASAARSSISYIDLRFGNRLYYKLK